MEQAQISKKFKILLIVLTVIAIAALVLICVLWVRLQRVEVATGADTETAQLVTDIGNHLMLPQGEDPELLTVSDLSQVQGQPFFANALIGDKVLVYKIAAKAVLWRPAVEKIIEVYPINLSAQ